MEATFAKSESIPELIRLSATRVVDLLSRGKVSPGELLDTLQIRIDEVEPDINALPILCMERARTHARKIENGQSETGLLKGLPVAIKDLIDVSEVRSTYGSIIHKNFVPDTSDILATHIEEQGGIIYAKSNTPEFGTGGNTVNAVLGATRNPWNTVMSAAGSSGGAAAALASGTAWLAQGSDMGGSLRNPASFCGIVGLRPTVGRIARTPASNVTDTLSTDGPMARNIEDLALFMDVMCGHEVMDPLSVPSPGQSYVDVFKTQPPKIPLAWSADLGITPIDPETRAVFLRAIDTLSSAGFEMVEAHPDFSGLNDIFHTLRAHSYATGFGNLLVEHRDKLNANVLWNIEQGMVLSIEDVARAEQERVKLVLRVQQFLKQYPVILTPATIVPPYPLTQDHVSECDGIKFDNYYQWLSIAYAFTTTLCPALSMPCGFTRDGLPVGLQLAAASYREDLLFSTASQFETIFDLSSMVPLNPNIQHTEKLIP